MQPSNAICIVHGARQSEVGISLQCTVAMRGIAKRCLRFGACVADQRPLSSSKADMYFAKSLGVMSLREMLVGDVGLLVVWYPCNFDFEVVFAILGSFPIVLLLSRPLCIPVLFLLLPSAESWNRCAPCGWARVMTCPVQSLVQRKYSRKSAAKSVCYC